MLEGRSDEVKAKLVKRLTDTCVDLLDSKPENVEVIIEEIESSNYAKAGILHNQREMENG